MAVTIKKKTWTLPTLVKRLFSAGTEKDTLLIAATDLEEDNAKLTVGPKKMTIMLDTGKELVQGAEVAINAETVSLFMQGKLSGAAKNAIRDKISWLITDAYKLFKQAEKAQEILADVPTYADPHDPAVKSEIVDIYLHGAKDGKNLWAKGPYKVAAIKALRSLTGLGLKESKELVELWTESIEAKKGFHTLDGVPTHTLTIDKGKDEGTAYVKFDPKKKMFVMGNSIYADPSNKPVALTSAKKLHQAVIGTSNGSVYHLIAFSDTVRIAARIRKNNNVAIRAASTAIPSSAAYMEAHKGFAAAGLEEKDGGHWSIHLDPENALQMKKCIGAVLFATGLEFLAISGKVSDLVGVGT